MNAVLIAINIIAGLFLIGVVLLQSGKGADMGAAFGGANSTMFGPAGPGNALTKATAGFATLFMLTALALSVISADQKSVFDGSDLSVPAAAIPAADDEATAAATPPATGAFDPEAAAEAAAAASANVDKALDALLGGGGDAAEKAEPAANNAATEAIEQ